MSDSCDPWTVACQAPLSMRFFRQEYWSGLPFPSLRVLPDPGIEPRSPALQVDSLQTELWGRLMCIVDDNFSTVLLPVLLMTLINEFYMNSTLPTKVLKVKGMVFPVVMYRCESWTIKKAEHWRTDAFELWCWRRLYRVRWAAGKSNQSILKEINPEYSLEGLMLKMKL